MPKCERFWLANSKAAIQAESEQKSSVIFPHLFQRFATSTSIKIPKPGTRYMNAHAQ